MTAAEWMPMVLGLVGGGGVGAILTTILSTVLSARNSVYKNLNDLVDQLQEDREVDRQTVSVLTSRVNIVLTELLLEREYSSALHSWGLAGGPPPPPVRPHPPTQ